MVEEFCVQSDEHLPRLRNELSNTLYVQQVRNDRGETREVSRLSRLDGACTRIDIEYIWVKQTKIVVENVQGSP